ncbi:MAG TPA: hypothetical protein VFM15_09110 [Gammaproteobacteria bacterium]|nr:hypothetical protein [Gammaproteobacteria bacterium]
MLRKLNASLLALTGLLIGLGAFGHSFMGRKALDAGLARVALDPHTDKLIYLVWYFCGGCMLVFGLLVIASAWRAWHGENRLLPVSGLIGLFYLVTGVLSLAYMHEPFWSVFVVLGGLAFLFSLALRKA